MEKTTIATSSPRESFAKMQSGTPMVDVREYPEWTQCHVEGATLIPLGDLKRNPRGAAPAGEVLVLCRSGRRASEAAESLAAEGLASPCVVSGGIEAWQAAGLPTLAASKSPLSLERQVRIGAGALILLGLLVPSLRAISYIVPTGLVFAGITGWCGMALLLAKMPWNRRPHGGNVHSCGSHASNSESDSLP